LVVSVDGHVPDVLEYLESLHEEFPHLIKLVHPFACYDHPDSFPGDDPQLNMGYKGDSYGNPRTSKVTCCKHHFTWLLSTVFSLDALSDADTFLFLEEDYVVATNIFAAIASGLNAMDDLKSPNMLGLNLDTSHGGLTKLAAAPAGSQQQQSWQVSAFVSGPMTMNRDAYRLLVQSSKEYCEYDEYNWDWSFVHLMDKQLLPFVVLEPHAAVLAQHFGVEGGMHGHVHQVRNDQDLTVISGPPFEGTTIRGVVDRVSPRKARPNGGWGHSADQAHCTKLLSGIVAKV
jgi:alpha-1,6-mannosyl-glycoprotein beta-1,2-N-acetylglucosaminyltransferase